MTYDRPPQPGRSRHWVMAMLAVSVLMVVLTGCDKFTPVKPKTPQTASTAPAAPPPRLAHPTG